MLPVILVADDLDIVRSLCKNALQSQGFEIVEAPDGPAAIRAFQENKDRVAFSLIDVSMPGIDGFDVVRRLLQEKPTAPAALISGADAESILPADLCGRCLTLNKPFTVKTLRDLVNQALGRASMAKTAAR